MRIGIITGASSGIGKAFAHELDKKGLDGIWLIGRDMQRLQEVQSKLKTESCCLALDLNNNDSYKRIENLLCENKCHIEYLVLSAGVGYTGRFDTLGIDKISSMINTNCTSLSASLYSALPYVSQNGQILLVASGAGFLPQPEFSVYAATKSYVISLSRAIRSELKSRKINVTAVCPGPVDTQFFANLENVKDYKRKFLISPQQVACGSLRAAKKNKPLYVPTISMKLVHFASKILPTSLIIKFSK